MKTKLSAAWWAMRWLCFAIGAIVIGAWFAARPGWMLGLPAGILLAGAWYLMFRLRIAAGKGRPLSPARRAWGMEMSRSSCRSTTRARQEAVAARIAPAATRPLSRRAQRETFVDLAPKRPQKAWMLLEHGKPVATETRKVMVDNWTGLGDEFEAVPQ